MAASINYCLMTGLLLCVAWPALALESLPDPTRPAVGMHAPSSGAGVRADSSEGGATEVVQTPVKAGLQSVIISPQHRAAIINGTMVELGGKVGDAKLVEVRENSVVLQDAQGKHVMELFPGVSLNKLAVQKEEPAPKSIKNDEDFIGSGHSDLEPNKDERKSK